MDEAVSGDGYRATRAQRPGEAATSASLASNLPAGAEGDVSPELERHNHHQWLAALGAHARSSRPRRP